MKKKSKLIHIRILFAYFHRVDKYLQLNIKHRNRGTLRFLNFSMYPFFRNSKCSCASLISFRSTQLWVNTRCWCSIRKEMSRFCAWASWTASESWVAFICCFPRHITGPKQTPRFPAVILLTLLQLSTLNYISSCLVQVLVTVKDGWWEIGE